MYHFYSFLTLIFQLDVTSIMTYQRLKASALLALAMEIAFHADQKSLIQFFNTQIAQILSIKQAKVFLLEPQEKPGQKFL